MATCGVGKSIEGVIFESSTLHEESLREMLETETVLLFPQPNLNVSVYFSSSKQKSHVGLCRSHVF